MATGLQPIYERLNGTKTYHPYNAKTFADWSLEAGDEVSVSRDGVVYTSPVHVSTMTWKGSQDIVLESNGEKERDAIAKVSAQKFAKGGGFRNARSQYAENVYLEWNQDYLYSRMEITAEYLRSTFEDRANYLYSRVEQTASYWRTTLEDRANYLYSRVEQTASRWSAELANTDQKLTTSIEATASGLRVETENRQRQDAVLAGRLDVSDTKVDLLVTVEDDRPVLWYASRQSSDWPEGRGSTRFLYYVADEKAYYEWKDGQFVKKKEGSMSPLVNAGGIVSAINEDKTISTRIYGDHIYIGGDSAETYIGGTLRAAKAYADTLTAHMITTDNMASIDAEFDTMQVDGQADFMGAVYIDEENGFLETPFIRAGSISIFDGEEDRELKVADAELVGTNTLKITKVDGTEINFSKAVTDIGYRWSDSIAGRLTVTAYPQEYAKNPLLGLVLDGSWSGNTYKGKVKYYEGTDDEVTYDVPGLTYSVSRAVTNIGYRWSNTGRLTVTAEPQNYSKNPLLGLVVSGSWNGNTYNGQVRYYEGSDDETTYAINGTWFSISRSVTGMTPNWSAGKLTVTANPQGDAFPVLGLVTEGSWSGRTYTGKVRFYYGHDSSANKFDTGLGISLTAPAVSIDIKDPVFATSPPTHVKNPTSLNTISNLIRNNSHGYVYFNVTAGGKNRWYYITTPT